MSAAKVFHPRASAYIVMFRGIIIVLGIFIFAATVVGQLKKGRFPAYQDLAISLTLPFVAYAFVSLIAVIGCRFFKVAVSEDGIKAYNMFGISTFARWDELKGAEVVPVSGVPYIMFSLKDRKTDMNVPLWLDDLPGFYAAVQSAAPADHPIQKFTRDLIDLNKPMESAAS